MLRGMANAEAWSKRVADWRASGLTAKEFCAKHGLALSGLRYWTYRLRAAEKASEANSVKLVPITVVSPDAEPASSTTRAEHLKPALTLELGAARISIPAGFDRGTLRAVLDVLGEHLAQGAR
jgi:transposase